MSEIPVVRRFLLAAIAIAVSGVILRAQLADALVIRGDGCLYRAQPRRALGYYRRALWIDRADGVAVDRFAFVASTLRDGPAVRQSIAYASAYLGTHRDDDVVRMDRAMAYWTTGQPAQALGDFAAVGRKARDARALAFAGYAAQAIGRRVQARRLWRSALTLQPGFVAALHGLARTETHR